MEINKPGRNSFTDMVVEECILTFGELGVENGRSFVDGMRGRHRAMVAQAFSEGQLVKLPRGCRDRGSNSWKDGTRELGAEAATAEEMEPRERRGLAAEAATAGEMIPGERKGVAVEEATVEELEPGERRGLAAEAATAGEKKPGEGTGVAAEAATAGEMEPGERRELGPEAATAGEMIPGGRRGLTAEAATAGEGEGTTTVVVGGGAAAEEIKASYRGIGMVTEVVGAIQE